MTRNLLTVRQFAEKHRAFSEASLRFSIQNSNKNGFDKVIRRLGRKILIDECAFFKWVDALSRKPGRVCRT